MTRRLPDSTRASDLILAGRDAQAVHAALNLYRRAARLLMKALDDGSPLHHTAHMADGRRVTRQERVWQANRIRVAEALVELMEALL